MSDTKSHREITWNEFFAGSGEMETQQTSAAGAALPGGSQHAGSSPASPTSFMKNLTETERVEHANDLVIELKSCIRSLCEELAELGHPVRRVVFEIPKDGPEINRFSLTYAPPPVQCPKHPKYTAARVPRCDCGPCREFYRARRSR